MNGYYTSWYEIQQNGICLEKPGILAILPLAVIFIFSSVLLSILMIVAFGDRWYNSLSTSYYDTKTNVKIIGSLKFQ